MYLFLSPINELLQEEESKIIERISASLEVRQKVKQHADRIIEYVQDARNNEAYYVYMKLVQELMEY